MHMDAYMHKYERNFILVSVGISNDLMAAVEVQATFWSCTRRTLHYFGFCPCLGLILVTQFGQLLAFYIY